MGIKRVAVSGYQEMSDRAALLVIQRIKEKPDLVLGLATGSTPLGLYERLVESYQQGETDFSQVATFNLDEYCGLSKNHPQSYQYFMDKHLFSLVNIDCRQVHFPQENDGLDKYEQKIKDTGGVDVQILGIGRNGHIGFNEPGSAFTSRTRVVDLTDVTIKDNARFFARPEEVPRRAVTMGLATIMDAKEILLLASGASKASVVERLMTEKQSVDVPASILWGHPKIMLIVDKEADGN
ncbi:MAG: glucosamine-6-phosphate deaminase [Candidatus Andersenbacteria bacterium RIFCSPHIGHO2_12_FULL_46_9]|nr:MAG: Glucosamine-6-phosphate deaminase [Parcubacteria group bacterium GW2011_GWA2_45_14]OGY35453.1 MAG: glucosamine-6-phosphate deaminase [Candidatus Andersenbacteria bacterium RIFCSPHIGHO2_02_FULL_46_16]OGY36869.1 MAG: glucosamine-6-phosphate deaminase [Candidatus Andersenbacteria bacterium RIFCSPLOWO2_02_FULL_46_11]OGY38374.1 MAG: glucosamine-6-phosphate deaminase [Candidatus Andersenbacteria bacterium RIFCSPHIGHO2_12_FULL_46_9]OGY41911.1 MAG: glucosamine-6-phosphate deaminase [Candidatus 